MTVQKMERKMLLFKTQERVRLAVLMAPACRPGTKPGSTRAGTASCTAPCTPRRSARTTWPRPRKGEGAHSGYGAGFMQDFTCGPQGPATRPASHRASAAWRRLACRRWSLNWHFMWPCVPMDARMWPAGERDPFASRESNATRGQEPGNAVERDRSIRRRPL